MDSLKDNSWKLHLENAASEMRSPELFEYRKEISFIVMLTNENN